LAFILAIDEVSEVVTTGAVARVQSVIGFDPDENVSYSATVSLDSGTPSYGAELNFWIDENREGFLPGETFWNSTQTHFIKGPDRQAVLQWILNATDMLISQTAPECVSMATMDSDLPTKAIRKYMMIKAIFAKHGFLIRTKESKGYISWLMERTGVGWRLVEKEAMKRELDADFVLRAKERAVARASALRNDSHSQKVAERGRELLEAYHRDHSRGKKAYA
jgi:hypothetical protein